VIERHEALEEAIDVVAFLRGHGGAHLDDKFLDVKSFDCYSLDIEILKAKKFAAEGREKHAAE